MHFLFSVQNAQIIIGVLIIAIGVIEFKEAKATAEYWKRWWFLPKMPPIWLVRMAAIGLMIVSLFWIILVL